MEAMIILLLIVAALASGYYAWQQKQTVDTLTRDLNSQKADNSRTNAEKDKALDDLKKQLAGKDAEIATLGEKIATIEKDTYYKKALMLTLANSAYDALIVVDKDCTIIGINNSAEELFHHESPLGEALVTVTNVPELRMMVEDALTNEETSFEEQITIDESVYRVRTQVIRRDDNLFVGLALMNITQLVRLNRARRDMVANISHELRHPLANIRIIIDSLFHDQDKPKRKDSISSLRAIARETDNLLWLVQEMSDLSMIESGQAIVRMVPINLVDLVDEAIERLNEQSSHRNIQLVRHVPEKLYVLCDFDLAQRVLVNLLHNALKWSPHDDAITISATSSETEEVTIRVLDNGPGVPEESVERIFERFFQVDSSRSGAEGTGLGLSICKHIVEAHGGRIWAESNKDGAGGRFLFTLLTADDPDQDMVEHEVIPSEAAFIQEPVNNRQPEPETQEEQTETEK